MAITPTNALILTDEQILAISAVTEAVDQYLADNYKEDQICIIRNALISDLFKFEQKVLDSFVASYVSAGWNVIKYNNEKQGLWLSFSKIA